MQRFNFDDSNHRRLPGERNPFPDVPRPHFEPIYIFRPLLHFALECAAVVALVILGLGALISLWW